jgi:hypothetical protein
MVFTLSLLTKRVESYPSVDSNFWIGWGGRGTGDVPHLFHAYRADGAERATFVPSGAAAAGACEAFDLPKLEGVSAAGAKN